ncbi:MAG: CPBP family intramembrane metalloprotease [Desulfobacterales bacterium]|nr:CPBP family intramembrane metalloprotease [Desulfobacterales bacterium]
MACYLALVGGIFVSSLIVGLTFLGGGIDPLDLPFPIALVLVPVNEAIILVITLVFARYRDAGLGELGLKKPGIRALTIVLMVAVPLFLLGASISVFEELVFGPDPLAEAYIRSVVPRNLLQLIAMIALSFVLVGPCEELAFRGFVQRGFENSFGAREGLLITSILFGILHGLNTLYAIAPSFVGGLVLGYVWQRTGGNTTASALLHGANNSISLVVAFLFTV